MAVKRNLKVLLMADDFIVAESTDERLWRSVLDEVYRAEDPDAPSKDLGSPVRESKTSRSAQMVAGGGAVAEFADELGVSIEQVQGACRPSENPPYIRLDHHHWEAMKRGTPERGPAAVSPVVLAGTLGALWARYAGLDNPRIKDLQDILNTVNVRDKNPTRGLRNCPWLQTDSGKVVINPASISKAIALARRYCKKDWKSEE